MFVNSAPEEEVAQMNEYPLIADHGQRRGSDTGPLDIMYRVDGSPELHEEILPEWEGYRGSYPVRIGNGAAGQRQLDIYGEALDAIHYIDRFGVEIGQPGWLAICELLEWLADNWDQPEEEIWETRGRKDFTYGRLMCWVAFDRAIRLAARMAGRRPCRAGWPSATRSTTRRC
jgi:GH15 family glucan-1,4-alpha-glucosidase